MAMDIYFDSDVGEKILEGKKWSTILDWPSLEEPIRVGEELTFHIFERGDRFDKYIKERRLVRVSDETLLVVEKPNCVSMDEIKIHEEWNGYRIILNGEVAADIPEIKLSEGVKYDIEVIEFVRDCYRIPFRGMLVGWEKL